MSYLFIYIYVLCCNKGFTVQLMTLLYQILFTDQQLILRRRRCALLLVVTLNTALCWAFHKIPISRLCDIKYVNPILIPLTRKYKRRQNLWTTVNPFDPNLSNHRIAGKWRAQHCEIDSGTTDNKAQKPNGNTAC